MLRRGFIDTSWTTLLCGRPTQNYWPVHFLTLVTLCLHAKELRQKKNHERICIFPIIYWLALMIKDGCHEPIIIGRFSKRKHKLATGNYLICPSISPSKATQGLCVLICLNISDCNKYVCSELGKILTCMDSLTTWIHCYNHRSINTSTWDQSFQSSGLKQP